MEGVAQSALPLLPLLRSYCARIPQAAELDQVAGLGPRFQAVRGARALLLSEKFLDSAPATEFVRALTTFYQAVVAPPLHGGVLTLRAGLVRHGFVHLLHGTDALSLRLRRCLEPGGPYHVAGLGPAFWSAVAQALDPVRHPAWLPAIETGLRRLGLWQPSPGRDDARSRYTTLQHAYDRLRQQAPELTALHLDHFLTLVGQMHGRHLETGQASDDVADVIRGERSRLALRRRLKERGTQLEQARRQLEEGLRTQHGPTLRGALVLVDPACADRAPIDWDGQAEALTLWIGRLWEADEPDEMLRRFWEADPVPGAGLWLPTAVLHLKDARRYHRWDEASRRGYATLDDSIDLAGPPWERYRLFNEGIAGLRQQYRLHPLEAADVLAALARDDRAGTCASRPFGGFCADTFDFLDELARNNNRRWMLLQRDRYHFAVRGPLVELCRLLAERYVEPVLGREHGWHLETTARSGRALTSVCKNDYGRSVPYNTAQWITFYRRDASRRGDAQLFVRLAADGVCYGLRLGRTAREANRLFRRNFQVHAELLYRALCASGAVGDCLFGDAEEGGGIRLTSPADLRTWAVAKTLVASKTVSADDPLLTGDDLVGDILLTFDRLLPAYACAVEADPEPFLRRRTATTSATGPVCDADFCRATHLDSDWLRRARSLLELKRQLILQGVPGTGKTHVARLLARLLTGGRDEAVRLVQFHPAYSYEEFVEGIKVKSVEVNGRHDVTYPVEDGLLCAFAADAARSPAQPHVLIIDEINRGNLPRVFGELLYLLEYRDEAVTLPYSRRAFRLPANLYVLATMNAADRSVALVDQALRRRFSFLEMPPDGSVLSAWLRQHPPAAGPAFADVVLRLFERLNARLRSEMGPPCQVGHSYFMVPELDEARLRVVWEHHVRPLLDEYSATHSRRTDCFELDDLVADDSTRKEGRKRPVEIPG